MLGVTPVEFHHDLWHHNTRVPTLLCGLVCMILRLAVLVESHMCRTDGRTDEQTDNWVIAYIPR